MAHGPAACGTCLGWRAEGYPITDRTMRTNLLPFPSNLVRKSFYQSPASQAIFPSRLCRIWDAKIEPGIPWGSLGLWLVHAQVQHFGVQEKGC